MKAFLSVLLALLLLPLTALAQDEAAADEPPGFLMFNQNMVTMGDLGTVNRLADSLMVPILDQLVDEGLATNAGVLIHRWGDDWNWNFYMFTKDHASFLTAWGELVTRMIANDSTSFDVMYQHVKEHKDNLYNVRHFKGRELAEGEEPPTFLMLNQHKVQNLPAANALMDSTSALVLDGMVDDGTIYFWGQANHSWGDEFNFNYYMGTRDLTHFAEAWGEYIRRIQAEHPGSLGEFGKLSHGHKDNLYYIRHQK